MQRIERRVGKRNSFEHLPVDDLVVLVLARREIEEVGVHGGDYGGAAARGHRARLFAAAQRIERVHRTNDDVAAA